MSISVGAKKKGYIIRQDTKEQMTFQFNPTTFDHGRSATYSVSGSPGMNYVKVQYVRGNEISYSIDLFMYCKGEKVNTINNAVKFIKKLLPPETNSSKFVKPPEVIVCVGKFIKRCVVTGYNIHIEESDTKNNPVNATITLDFLQVGVS